MEYLWVQSDKKRDYFTELLEDIRFIMSDWNMYDTLSEGKK